MRLNPAYIGLFRKENTFMKRNRLIAFIMSICMCFGTIGLTKVNAAEDSSSALSKYEYFLKTPEDSAYVMFGDKIEERYCSFIDGIEMGITDSSNPLYNERVSVEGIDARYFLKENYANIDVDNSFFSSEDHEFVFSIVFYDYGPNQGKFYFDYYDIEGNAKRLTLIKPGKVQGWFVKTVYVDDADLSKTFENGANIRLVTGAYNAFKKVEISNLAKLKREGKNAEISSLASEYGNYFKQLKLIDENDSSYAESNMYKKCSISDAWSILKKIMGENESSIPSGYMNNHNTITCGELLTLFMQQLNIPVGEDVLSAARAAGLVTGQDLFLSAEGEASYYNLLGLAYNAFYYKKADGSSLALKLIQSGIYTMDLVKSVTDPKFLEIYYSTPIKCPYKKITDYETGRTFYYMNFFGEEAVRPYVTMQSWSSDGKSFIGGTRSGYMFIYNTETQMMTFVDDNMSYYGDWLINATIGTDDCIYYLKSENRRSAIWRADIKTLEKEKLTDIPDNVVVGGVSITNDCKYIGFDYEDTLNKTYPAGIDLGARYCIETDTWDVFSHEFLFSQYMNHVQVNPVNPNLMFFCHEGAWDSSLADGAIYDRVWTYDFTTGIADNIFKQGVINGIAIQKATHEVWSNDGEYIFFIAQDGAGKTPSIVRLDYDGRHRQYYYNPTTLSYWHCYPSGDGRYVVADGSYITIVNTQTNQSFKITRWIGHGQAVHPYHPHPQVARNCYKVNWGMRHEGVLGIMWYDFSEIDEKEVAKGGRYYAGENLERVSYGKLPCETKETYKSGKDCLYVKQGNALYLDIDESVVDSVNDSVTVSFDYLDNGRQPIVLTYTSGVNTDNDYWKIDNANKSVKRTGTGKWKHAEITIESGNFENPGEYSTDLKINGVCSNMYITNIEVRKGK